jgi:hypothetical protein
LLLVERRFDGDVFDAELEGLGGILLAEQGIRALRCGIHGGGSLPSLLPQESD